MRVVILGAGAVGSLFGALLARAGVEVLLVGRPEHVRAIRERGLSVEGSVEGCWTLSAMDHLPPTLEVDAALLTVKSFDLAEASRPLATALTGTTPILLPQNGLGVERIVLESIRTGGPGRAPPLLVRAVNTLPATLIAPGRVRYAGSGEVRLAEPSAEGPMATAIRTFHDLFASAGIPVRYLPDLEGALWLKAVVNAAINPVTAAYGVRNGALVDEPYHELAESLVREGVEAAVASGHPLDLDEALRELWRTVEATSANRSSMLQDVDRGRPTELEFISGALLRAGESHQRAMPHTRAIIERVRARARATG